MEEHLHFGHVPDPFGHSFSGIVVGPGADIEQIWGPVVEKMRSRVLSIVVSGAYPTPAGEPFQLKFFFAPEGPQAHTLLSKVVLLMATQTGTSAGGRGTPLCCPPTQRGQERGGNGRSASPLLQPARAGQGPANRRQTTLDEAESLTPDSKDDWWENQWHFRVEATVRDEYPA